MEFCEIYSYCTLVILLLILSVDFALVRRFRMYYFCHGYGVVTCVLLNLVVTQLLTSLLYGTAAVLIFIAINGEEELMSHAIFFNNTGTLWILSATLVHVIVLTCLRIYSVSYGNRFLKFVGSSFNISLVMVKLWFVSLAMTTVTVISTTVTTCFVFYIGVSATGLFALITFTTTKEKRSNTYFVSNIPHDQNIDGVRNPQKTFVVFTGIFISFAVFVVPSCITNLYFNIQKKSLDEGIYLVVSLWCLLGVLTNSVWIWYRLRCTVNHVTGFYSNWSLEEHNKDTAGDS